MQVYVPGVNPLAVAVTGSAGPFGEFPTLALLESTHVIVELVTPGTSELALTEMSVSGESVKLTPWPRDTYAAYLKFGVHERPTLAVAAVLRISGAGRSGGDRIVDARLAVGCVNPRPVRMPSAEARLAGVSITDVEPAAREAADLAAASADPADDLYGSADYKREMVAVFVRRALRIAVARARGAEPVERFPHAVVA